MSNKKSRKIIKHKHKPRPSTHPKIKNNPSDSDSSKVSWRLSDTDRGGNWGCSLSILDDSKAKEIIRKLRDYDSMTWADLKGRNSHTIPTNKISKEAKDRLLEIEGVGDGQVFESGQRLGTIRQTGRPNGIFRDGRRAIRNFKPSLSKTA